MAERETGSDTHKTDARAQEDVTGLADAFLDLWQANLRAGALIGLSRLSQPDAPDTKSGRAVVQAAPAGSEGPAAEDPQ